MIKYVTGNLLEDSAEALVNTVNCEGFMGKGLAYQFKLNYPETNKDYIKACKQYKLMPGVMHSFREKGKLIINFPTKNKWRSHSQIKDVESGLDALVAMIIEKQIKSIAIPPLGCGNGGLDWMKVQKLIENKLEAVSDHVDIRVYIPSQSIIDYSVAEPSLGLEAYILMVIKEQMASFSMEKLYTALSLINILSNNKYLCTKTGKVSIKSLNSECKKIGVFQKHFGCSSTDEAKNILYNKLVSKSTIAALKKLNPIIVNVCAVVDSQDTNNLEALLKLCNILAETGIVEFEEMDMLLQDLQLERNVLDKLSEANVMEITLMGYCLNKKN